MEKNDYYIGLEISSSMVKLVAGYVLNGQIYILSNVKDKCLGISDGVITDIDEVIKTIRNVINIASREINYPITDVTLAIPAFNLNCMPDIDFTSTIDGNDIIKHIDVSNVISKFKKRKLSNPELTIVDIVPDTYILDNNETYHEEPIGKKSTRLTMHATIYAINEKILNLFVSCVNKAGYNVVDTVISPYASSLYLSTLKIIPDNYLIVDIGNSVTNISYVNQRSIIMSSRIYRFGAKNIFSMVSEKLGIDLEKAEELIETYGIDHNLNFETYIYDKITLDDLSECIIRSLTSLVDAIKQVMGEVKNEEIPLVLIGGVSYLHSIKKILVEELQMEVLDYVMNTMGARDRSLITALGLIKYASLKPKVNEEETITTQVSRVEKKKNNSYNFDDEL